jgi:hypothetical protein
MDLNLFEALWNVDTFASIDRISTRIGCPGVMTILSHELVV